MIGNIVGRESTNLVAEAIAGTGSSILQVTGLDIVRDGGIYDLVIVDWDTSSSIAGHVLTFNGISANNKYNLSFTRFGSMDHGKGWEDYFNHTNLGLCYTNGWNSGSIIFYTVGTLIRYDNNWVGFNGQTIGGNDYNSSNPHYIISNQGGIYKGTLEVPTITSLEITAQDQGCLIGRGSYIKVYKR